MTRTKVFVLVLAISLLANCTSPLPTSPSPTERVAPQATDTLTHKPSETATRTPSSTSTPSPTPTLTWTPLPTLSAQQSQVKINELLETNGGCELPCWWGITPNETKWTETLYSIKPFIFDVQESTDVRIENGKELLYTNGQFYFDIPGEAESGQVTLGAIDDIVIGMTVYPPVAERRYKMHQLLALLGPPKQILINAQSSSPISELPPTVLTLDYSDVGIWASYGYIPIQVGENLVICPKSRLGTVSIYDNVGGRLRLFDPARNSNLSISIEEYANMVGGFTAMKLEDVTNMNIESFYNTFVDPEPQVCLETPANLWP